MSEQTAGRRRIVQRLVMVVWLTLVWIMLWGTFDLGTLFFGVLVGLLVSILFPLPAVNTGLVLRPLRLLGLIGYLIWDMVSSTLRVSWQALRYGPDTKSGIVAVRLRSDSDHLAAMVANALSLAPGKFVLQIDLINRICYVYALGMGPTDGDSIRREVLTLERRVVQAIGSADDVALVTGREV